MSRWAWVWALALLLGCGAATRGAQPAPAPIASTSASAARIAEAAPVRLRIATFNVQVLGPAKAGRPEVLRALAQIIRRYDLVALQEIRDRTGEAARRLLEAVEEGAEGSGGGAGPRYGLELSERTGREPDDRHSQEQYAYYYRMDRLRVLPESTLYDDSEHDYFQREPYLSRFEVLGSDATFVLINVHTRPRAALQEIAAIEHVFGWARVFYPAEDVFIALGDFNAGCGYASEEDLDALPLHGEAYDWVVPHSADTNLAPSACPYDRIVIAAPQGSDLVEDWGVDRAFDDRAISDHWPVWVDLRLAP